jgi:hypothetical protein
MSEDAKSDPVVRGPWTDKEIAFLRASYGRVHAGKTTTREIAAFLLRPRNAILGKADRLGLCKPSRRLTRQERR